MKNIVSRPFPRIDLILSNFYFNQINNELLFFKNGREAMVFGLNYLGIKKGSTILVPAYICNTFTDFIIRSGFKIRYLDINEEMNFDVNILDNIFKSENIKAIIFVYYFGLPFDIIPLLKLCKKYNIKIIEDCSHGFQTKINDQNIGTFGDMTIYSFRKILPISDGGALRLKDYKLQDFTTSHRFSFKDDFIYFVSRLIENIVINYLKINIYSDNFLLLKNKIKKYLSKNEQKIDHPFFIFPKKKISILLSIFLNNKEYLFKIFKTRKNNFNFLLNEIKSLGLKSYIDSINKETVPQFFIIEDNLGGLSEWLRENGIGAIKWPGEELPREIKLSPSLYLNSIKLNDKLVMIPIHQDIKYSSYNELIFLLNEWNSKNIN